MLVLMLAAAWVKLVFPVHSGREREGKVVLAARPPVEHCR